MTRAGEGKVPVNMVGSRAAGPDSTLPFSQRTHKEQGTYLERETPHTLEEVAVEEAEKELAREQAKDKRQQAKRAREEADLAEASKKQRGESPQEGPIIIEELGAIDSEESSPSIELVTRERRSKNRNDVQLPSPTPEILVDAELQNRSGKEPMESEAPQDHAAIPPTEQGISEEALPSIPKFPENLSMGVDEDDSVEVNEPLMRE